MIDSRREFGTYDSVTARYGQLGKVQKTSKGAHSPRVITLYEATIREIVPFGKKVRKEDERTPAETLGID